MPSTRWSSATSFTLSMAAPRVMCKSRRGHPRPGRAPVRSRRADSLTSGHCHCRYVDGGPFLSFLALTLSMALLVECVPNFSEGRDPLKVERIARMIGSVTGVHLLDTHMDPDHNRSVITFVGPPSGVEEAAMRAAG